MTTAMQKSRISSISHSNSPGTSQWLQNKKHTKKTPIKYYEENLQRQRIILHSALEKSEDAQGVCVKPILFACVFYPHSVIDYIYHSSSEH